jgi:tripartite-type tricarboxylate transporter receptor subunit TctC
VLAAATPKRLSVRSDLPTIDESAVPGYAVNVWFGMAAPTGTPESVLDKVHADVTRILRSPEFREAVLKPQALEPSGNSRADFAAELKQESARWAHLVKNSGAKAD